MPVVVSLPARAALLYGVAVWLQTQRTVICHACQIHCVNGGCHQTLTFADMFWCKLAVSLSVQSRLLVSAFPLAKGPLAGGQHLICVVQHALVLLECWYPATLQTYLLKVTHPCQLIMQFQLATEIKVLTRGGHHCQPSTHGGSLLVKYTKAPGKLHRHSCGVCQRQQLLGAAGGQAHTQVQHLWAAQQPSAAGTDTAAAVVVAAEEAGVKAVGGSCWVLAKA